MKNLKISETDCFLFYNFFFKFFKLAFNKRVRSVKAKREKLNAEMRQRQQQEQQEDQVEVEEEVAQQQNGEDLNHRVSSESDQQQTPSTAAITKQSGEEEEANACTCVKCSIVYHEAKIKGTTPSEIKCALTCTRCQQKLVNCKCCSASASSTANQSGQTKSDRCCTAVNTIEATTESECLSSTPVVNSVNSVNSASVCPNEPKTPPTQSTATSNMSQSVTGSPSVAFKNELNQFESKLFNIKNELVSFPLKLSIFKDF